MFFYRRGFWRPAARLSMAGSRCGNSGADESLSKKMENLEHAVAFFLRPRILPRSPKPLDNLSSLEEAVSLLDYAGMESEYPKLSGGSDAYEFYIETVLQWLCSDCGEYVRCTDDIRENEPEAPYGGWVTRKGKEAMLAGWYVRPLSKNGSLTSIQCLCPRCAKNHGLVIAQI